MYIISVIWERSTVLKPKLHFGNLTSQTELKPVNIVKPDTALGKLLIESVPACCVVVISYSNHAAVDVT